jgi:hypothetical protein
LLINPPISQSLGSGKKRNSRRKEDENVDEKEGFVCQSLSQPLINLSLLMMNGTLLCSLFCVWNLTTSPNPTRVLRNKNDWSKGFFPLRENHKVTVTEITRSVHFLCF